MITVDPGHHWGQLCQWDIPCCSFLLRQGGHMPLKSHSSLCYSSVLFTVRVIAPSHLLIRSHVLNEQSSFCRAFDQLWLSFRYFYKWSILPYYKPVWWFEFYMLFSFCCSSSTSLLEKFLFQSVLTNGSPDSEPCLVNHPKYVRYSGTLLRRSRTNISKWRWQHVFKKDQLEFTPERNNG